MSANIWKSYTLRSYEIVVKKKNIGARTGFQPITTAIPVQRSTVTSRTDLNFFGPYFHYHWNSASDRESLLEFSGPITEGRNS